MASDSQTALLALACELISRPSITPNDAGCQQIIGERLQALGFELEPMIFADTTNLWATRGNAKPLFVFAGHTDVVPSGDSALWSSPPFTPSIKDGYLYGRGAADMKGALAAMVIATERFIATHPDHLGAIGFLITSDEEGPFINGTTKVVDQLMARNQLIDYCIVGEPSSTEVTGDTIKNGRRGSLTANLTVFGKQGHVAYPHLAQNPIHLALPALTELSLRTWDQGNAFFPPTSMQLVNLNAGTGASNVIAANLEAQFNFRFSSELSSAQIKQQVTKILNKYGFNYQLTWSLSGEPFLTSSGALLNAATIAIETELGITPVLSTSGGTSDGRFIAKMGGEVIELGPENSTIHQIDERVNIAGLTSLVSLYYAILEQVLLA